MTTTQKNRSHFYELLKNRVITLTQFRHIYQVLNNNGKFQRSLFDDGQFKEILNALTTHAKDDTTNYNKNRKTGEPYKEFRYSFGTNPKNPSYTGYLPELAKLMENEEITLHNRRISRIEKGITTRAIERAYKFGALKVDSSAIDLSKLPTLEINGRVVKVAVID